MKRWYSSTSTANSIEATAPPAAQYGWPEVPAPVAATVELRCDRCGYKIRWQAKRRPTDYDAMAADFVRKHTVEGCHDTTREAHGP